MPEAASPVEREESPAAVWLAWEYATAWQKRIARARLYALRRVAELLRNGAAIGRAREVAVAHCTAQGMKGCSVSALKRWGRVVRGKPRGDWLVYLLPVADELHAPRVNRRCKHERA